MALRPIEPEQLPAIAADAAARGPQLAERAFWMRRDLDQTANNREGCNRQMEIVGLVRANNAGPSN